MKEIVVGFRTDQQGLQLVQGIAKQMDRTTSDALRVLIKRAALELGVTAQQTDRHAESPVKQAA